MCQDVDVADSASKASWRDHPEPISLDDRLWMTGRAADR
jgi:hypothetical protein